MSLWLWLLILAAGGTPTAVILWSIYCRDEDEKEEGPGPSSP